MGNYLLWKMIEEDQKKNKKNGVQNNTLGPGCALIFVIIVLLFKIIMFFMEYPTVFVLLVLGLAFWAIIRFMMSDH